MHITCSISNEKLTEIIKEKIKTKSPFCISRIGDGEIYLLNNNAPVELVDRICKLWNIEINDYQQYRQKICQEILLAINESDLIGIMSDNNEISSKIKIVPDIWSIKKDFLIKNNVKIPICCDHQFTRSKMFGDPENLKDVLKGNPINIITPNKTIKIDILEEKLQCSVSVTNCTNNRKELINKLDKIEEQIVLYGVSITAKDLGVLLKRKGKIALDFGATLDAWSGILSRPWFKNGIQGHCVIK
jgi:hypothetical protein